tara:strand:- start:2480 stop:3208 length:729 start_codon:yes stop_codon:yes gene_type:complete
LKELLILLIIVCEFIFSNESKIVDRIIKLTDYQYNIIQDYEVDISVSMKVPAFRMPKKRYKVYFMQPDLIKVKSKGFGILPKTGIFTSPNDNFDNLSDITIQYLDDKNSNDIILSGLVIVDSLKIEMPNEYSKLTFKPIVEVRIDTSKWVIKSVITRIDTLKLFEIYNDYDIVDNDFYMPIESEVKYFLKDKKFSNWLKKDINTVVGEESNAETNELVEGNISVKYSNYKINRGLSKSIFEK